MDNNINEIENIRKKSFDILMFYGIIITFFFTISLSLFGVSLSLFQNNPKSTIFIPTLQPFIYLLIPILIFPFLNIIFIDISNISGYSIKKESIFYKIFILFNIISMIGFFVFLILFILHWVHIINQWNDVGVIKEMIGTRII